MSYIRLRSEEIFACPSPQFNNSSAGTTTTDTSGDTYQEPSGQTRITMPSYADQVVGQGSWHVSAGTGTIQLYNFTDSTDLGTTTTTSTSETSFTTGENSDSTNISDSITLRVKNSGAGNTITIDSGGLLQAMDLREFSTSAVGIQALVNDKSNPFFFIKTIKFIAIKGTTTSTYTADINLRSQSFANGVLTTQSLKNFTESDSGNVLTISNINKLVGVPTSGAGNMGFLSVLASSQTGSSYIAACCDVWALKMLEAE